MTRKFIATFGLLTFISCGESQEAIEKVCGPCPDVASGDLAVSGSAQIDGFFKALNIFQNANARISGEFQAHLDALAAAFGATADCDGASIADCAAAVKGKIEGELTANASGGLRINYVPPRCSASASVAVQAQAECTAQADVSCTPPTIDPGSIEVECQGQCTGGCSGSCSGSCVVEATGGSCSGKCEGSCEITAMGGATCEGTCNGGCSGACSARDEQLNCKGECTGMCTGTCEAKASATASCDGNCTGKCIPPMASATCEGECRGECDAKCTGSCKGSATPPSIEGGECDADVQANCKASASAQASASLDCTPPRLDIDFDFTGEATAAAQAAFLAKMSVLKTEMVGVIQGLVNARILVEGDADANIPAIQDVLVGQIDVAGNLTVDDLEGITPYGAICVAAALLDAGAAVVDAADELGGTVSASVAVSGSIGTF